MSKVLIQRKQIPLRVFFISCFTVLVTLSVNTSESSSDVMILTISSTFSFKMNEVNPLLALTVPFPIIFLSNLFIAFDC